MKICLVISPFKNPADARSRIERFLQLMTQLSEEIFIVTANFPYKLNERNVHIANTDYKPGKTGALIQIVRHLFLQLKISLNLLRHIHRSDIVIFWLSGTLFIPMFVTKIFRKKMLLFVTGSWAGGVKISYENAVFGFGKILFHITRKIEKISYILSDRIVLLAPSLKNQVGELAGARYLNKTVVAVPRPVSHEFFTSAPTTDRGKNIGYIGRLDKGKGLKNLIKSFSLLREDYNDLKLFLIGDGPLKAELESMAEKENVQQHISFTGWLSSSEITDYLHQLKVVVLPSHTEGLPVTLLEAMASRTPVLTTNVGGISDIIVEGKTGFFMEDNSPGCIAKNISRVINHPDIEKIAGDAQRYAEEHFTFEPTLEKYRMIIEDMREGRGKAAVP